MISTKINTCTDCGRALERKDAETDSIVIEVGDVACCCGSIDEYGNYFDALCIDCCPPHGAGIWDGKGAAGGYYIVNPSF
jgi:hypothetical protein